VAREVVKGIRRSLTRKTQSEHGYSWVPDGFEVGDIEVIVDLAQIARHLGAQAMANKSGRSRYMQGAIIVNVLSRRKEA